MPGGKKTKRILRAPGQVACGLAVACLSAFAALPSTAQEAGTAAGSISLSELKAILDRQQSELDAQKQQIAAQRELLDQQAALIDALQKRHRGRALRKVRQLHRLWKDYPTQTLAEAIAAALEYGLNDISRIETMVLRRIAGEMFRLPVDPEKDDG